MGFEENHFGSSKFIDLNVYTLRSLLFVSLTTCVHLKLILISISPLGCSNGYVNIVTSASPFLGTDMTCGRFFIYNLNLFIQILLICDSFSYLF